MWDVLYTPVELTPLSPEASAGQCYWWQQSSWNNNIHDIENQQDSVYMIFVHHYGSTRDSEKFHSSGVYLTLTDRSPLLWPWMLTVSMGRSTGLLAVSRWWVLPMSLLQSMSSSTPSLMRKFQTCALRNLVMKCLLRHPMPGTTQEDIMDKLLD